MPDGPWSSLTMWDVSRTLSRMAWKAVSSLPEMSQL